MLCLKQTAMDWLHIDLLERVSWVYQVIWMLDSCEKIGFF